jgi:hypothetical protein
MLLSSEAIQTFNSINNFQTASQWTIRAGDPNTLYYQLVDLDNLSSPMGSPVNSGFFGFAGPTTETPQRFIAGVGSSNQPASMIVTFQSLDPGQVIAVMATQDPNDGSVWSFMLSGSQTSMMAPGSGNVQFSLTMGINTYTWSVMNMIAVQLLNSGCC